MATPTDRPLRKDAERNRQRIMQAAREVFADVGLDVSLDEIARHAGVGVGTIYRRFPDKELLIEALFEEAVDQLVATAEEAGRMDDPWAGLVHVLTTNQERQAADRGLRQVLLSSTVDRRCTGRARARIAPIVGELLARAQADGTVRPDVTVHDLPLMQKGLGTIIDATRDCAPDAWRRHLTILLDGLRARGDAATPLPVPPLTDAQLEEAMAAVHRRR